MLVAWANESNWLPMREYTDAERKTAGELGLELAYGHWQEERDYYSDHEPDSMALTAVYHRGVLVGFIGSACPAMGVVFYENPGLGRRA